MGGGKVRHTLAPLDRRLNGPEECFDMTWLLQGLDCIKIAYPGDCTLWTVGERSLCSGKRRGVMLRWAGLCRNRDIGVLAWGGMMSRVIPLTLALERLSVH